MPTYIYNKKDFIEFIQEQVKADEVIVFTDGKTGSCSISKKKGIQVTHQYSHEAFKDEGIGHITFGETLALGVLIAKKKRLSKVGSDAMNKIQTT